MHLVKIGGKRNTHKVCTKHVKFTKREEKLVKVWGNNKFREIGGMYWNRENRGKLKIFSQWLKKVIRNFGRWKSENFSGKGKIGKIFHGVWNFFSQIVGNSKQKKCITALEGMDNRSLLLTWWSSIPCGQWVTIKFIVNYIWTIDIAVLIVTSVI